MRNRTAIFALLVLVALSLPACSSLTPSATMQSYMGHTAQEVILKWGPPARTITDGADGQVLVFEYWVPRSFVPYVGWIGGYTATRSFYVNGQGIVYNWRWQGL